MAISLNSTTKKWEVGFSTSDTELDTSGKYLDRNIVVKAPVPITSTDGDSVISYTNHIDTDQVSGTIIDKIDISVALPAGYYDAQTITKTIEDILPNLDKDATAGYILDTYKAYDENGKEILGTMPNRSGLATAQITVSGAKGTVAAAGSSGVTLGTATTTQPTEGRYLKISGTGGSVTASWQPAAGYYPGTTTFTQKSATSASDPTTKYYPLSKPGESITGSGDITIGAYDSTNEYYPLSTSFTATAKTTSAGYSIVNDTWTGTVTATGTVAQSAYDTLTAAKTDATSVASQYFKITGGYYPSDRNFTVRSASGFELELTDKSDSAVTVGAVSNGYHQLTTSIGGKLSAKTAGWFSGNAADVTDGTVIVGSIAHAGLEGKVVGTTALNATDVTYKVATTTAGYTTFNEVWESIPVWCGETA